MNKNTNRKSGGTAPATLTILPPVPGFSSGSALLVSPLPSAPATATATATLNGANDRHSLFFNPAHRQQHHHPTAATPSNDALALVLVRTKEMMSAVLRSVEFVNKAGNLM